MENVNAFIVNIGGPPLTQTSAGNNTKLKITCFYLGEAVTCPELEFACMDGETGCIDAYKVCDGQDDCKDTRDEYNKCKQNFVIMSKGKFLVCNM